MSIAEKITSKKRGATTANSTSAWLRCDRQSGRGWYAARADELRRRSFATNPISSLSLSSDSERSSGSQPPRRPDLISSPLEPVRPDAPLNGSRGHFVRFKPVLTAVTFQRGSRLLVKKKIQSDLVAVRGWLGWAAPLA